MNRSPRGGLLERPVISTSRPRARWLAAALATAIVLPLSACASEAGAEFAPERKAASDFFSALESGETGQIAALLTDDSALTSAVLDAAFYAGTESRPTDAKVVAAVESDPGAVAVTVDYRIEGDDRSINVIVVRSDGEARIDGWLHETLSLAPLRAPGAWEVNGSVAAGELEESVQFVALPGVYTFRYVDPEGLGTIDPDGAESASFEVEFPIDGGRLAAAVPTGVTARGSGVGAEPRLLAAMEDAVDTQLAALVAECSASGLTGESCPPELVSDAAALGVVDPGTIVWTDESERHIVPSARWGLVADYSVAFSYVDTSGRTGRTTVDTTLDAVVAPDARGEPTIRFS